TVTGVQTCALPISSPHTTVSYFGFVVFSCISSAKRTPRSKSVSARQRVHRHLQASWVAGSKDQALPCRALFCPSQYKNAPTATNAPVPPTTFAIASAGWASPGLGTNERAMVRDAVLNPTQESNNAVGLPPGTRITSGPAGSLCKRNIAANKNR